LDVRAEYKPFIVVISQSDKQMTFTQLKAALCNEKARTADDESVVMKTSSASMHNINKKPSCR